MTGGLEFDSFCEWICWEASHNNVKLGYNFSSDQLNVHILFLNSGFEKVLMANYPY